MKGLKPSLTTSFGSKRTAASTARDLRKWLWRLDIAAFKLRPAGRLALDGAASPRGAVGDLMARYLDQRLKLRHLRVIHAISQHASLLRASQALRLTQPALTRSLQEIEEIVGVRLYDRHAKG